MTVRLPVYQWGEGDRSALPVHGLTSSGRVWWRVASELADRGWRVVAPDLRGHGLAPPASRFAIEDYAGDLTRVGDGWDVVVGHSLGGAAVVVASTAPGWAGRAVLVDPAVTVADQQRDSLAAALLLELCESASDIAVANPVWHPLDVWWKRWSAAQVAPHVVEATLDDNGPWDVSPSLAAATVPTLVLAADPERGGMVDASALSEIVADDPRVVIRSVTGAGHSLFRDRSDVVVSVIVER